MCAEILLFSRILACRQMSSFFVFLYMACSSMAEAFGIPARQSFLVQQYVFIIDCHKMVLYFSSSGPN
jgi:hypothetical protein